MDEDALVDDELPDPVLSQRSGYCLLGSAMEGGATQL